ncbi:MAG TPA: VWA domain-containing protein [Acidimicrobiia bacterium]|nr:VWA domain-containing protein [Acidimicrobiia bacterium]
MAPTPLALDFPALDFPALDFSAPGRLWLLAVAAGLAVAYVVMQARRRRESAKFANPALLPYLVPGRAPWWRHAVALVFAGGLVASIVASAEPTVAATADRQQATIMLAIDTSDSMKATDVAPSRLAAAQAAARSFIEGLPATFSVGIVSADATPEVVVAPSTDHQAVETALNRLATSPGTALGDAIVTALDALPASAKATSSTASTSAAKPPAASIVLLSDGKSTQGRSDDEAIAAAAQANVPVSTISFGTADATVESAGQTVSVPVDASALQVIADGTKGTFFTAATADQLKAVYADINADVTTVPVDRSVAAWFAGAALLLLFATSLTSMLRSGRVVWA